jgi:YgiT-type zinc finger domain-containing protein
MICIICRQARTIAGLTSVLLERGEARYVVEKVPAQICPSCGEAFLQENIADRLLQSAEHKFESGQLAEVWAFDLP